MAPKTPSELREQLERENAEQPADGQSRTAEGMETPNPTRAEFFESLEKAGKPSS